MDQNILGIFGNLHICKIIIDIYFISYDLINRLLGFMTKN